MPLAGWSPAHPVARLGATESEAKERAAAATPSCPCSGTSPALRCSFSRQLSLRMLLVIEWCNYWARIAVAMMDSPKIHPPLFH
jgi:hypothetical protein